MKEFYQHLDIIIFLMTSVGVVLLFKRLKMSPVLGYLLAGVIIGPHVSGAIGGVETSHSIAEFGVVFLMFTIGLDLPWERLQELKRYVFGLAGLQVTITGAAFGGLAYWAGATIETAVLLGGGIALSSTAVVLQVLAERKELATRFGRITFAILLFQDLAVVVMLVWVTLMASTQGSSVWGSLGQALIKAVIVLVSIALLGRFVLRPLYRLVSMSRNLDLFMATTLLVILSTSLATGAAGLSMELGAFLAGLLLAETEYRHQIEADIKPFRSLLLGLFFMSVGMSIDPKLFVEQYPLILGVAAFIVIGKFGFLFGICKIFGLPAKPSVQIGMILATGGEFVFVLFGQGVQANLVTPELMQVIYLSVVITMALTPMLASLGKAIADRLGAEIGVALKAAEEETADLKNHVIIAGYGRVGQTVHTLLGEQLVPHVAIDLNMARVAQGRSQGGPPIFFGDARRAEVYRAMGAERAKAVVLTLGHFNASTRAIMTLRRYFPHLEVFVRVRDSAQAFRLREVGAHPVVPETFAPSFQLASAVLNLYGVPSDQIDKTLKKFRRDYLSPEAFEHGRVPWMSAEETGVDEDSLWIGETEAESHSSGNT
jgi:CPA2 family monovalent cation:H+ antiporter-2